MMIPERWRPTIAVVGDLMGWIGVAAGPILHTRDGGMTWLDQPREIPSGIWSMAFVDALNGWAVGEDGMILHTATGGETINDLIAQVLALGLPKGLENGLISTLENAKKSLEKGNTTAAIGQLGAFVNEVEALTRKGTIPQEAGEHMIAVAEAIITGLGRSVPKPVAPLETAAVPDKYVLEQNYPNPFNPETAIRFQVPEAIHVTIRIFNLLGQEIRRLTDQEFATGMHTLRWDGKDEYGRQAASGLYFYSIRAGDFTQVRKMSLVR